MVNIEFNMQYGKKCKLNPILFSIIELSYSRSPALIQIILHPLVAFYSLFRENKPKMAYSHDLPIMAGLQCSVAIIDYRGLP